MSIWTLNYLGTIRRLKDWGISNAKLRLQSLDVDTLTFEILPDDMNGTEEFDHDQIITLYCDGVPRFSGRVKEVPSDGQPQADRHRYVVAGPWWDLETIIFQGDRKIRVDPSDDPSPLQTVFTSYTSLFQDVNKGQVSVGAQIALAIDYAASKGAYISRGTTEPTINPPFEESHDLSTAEVIQRSIRWSPDSVGYFDYSSTPPTLHVKRRNSLSQQFYDLADGTTVQAFSVRKLVDLQPSGVKFYIERVRKTPDGKSWTYFDTITQGSDPDGRRGVVMTIPANNSDQDNGLLLSSLANDYWSAVSPLQYGGELTINEADYSATLVPGSRVNLTSGKPWMANMNALVQAVEVDLTTGQSKATLGAANHLGFQDIVALSRNSRTTTIKSSITIIRDSGEHTPPGSREIPTFAGITVCDGGSESTLSVRTN